jgi:ABC-2 type transport system ATP-binding protein
METEKDQNEYIIEVKNLTKKFNDFLAVDNINFKVKKGEIFAFLGPNGAGKTTTIKMLTTLLKPSSGKIMLNGFDPTRNQDEARRSFGIVFQDQSIDEELTAWENMAFHAGLYGVKKAFAKEKITRLLKFVELWDRKDTLLKKFSGGMKRRLEIARGLIHEPKIFFLDEPTLGLDPQTRANMWNHVMGLNREKKMTVFLTTHYIEEAEKMADRVAIIDKGKILIDSTVLEIKKETDSNTLEEAFLKITGRDIRDEEGNSLDRMRRFKRR